MKLLPQNIIRFFILLLTQLFVLDNIQFLGYINPMIYILFILSLPIHFSRNATIFLAFILGLTVDMFSNTIGIHAFASVFVGFFRTPIMKMFVPVNDFVNITPSPRTLGGIEYLKILVVFVLLHHSVLFLLESFTFYSIQMIVLKLILSSLVTIFILFVIEYSALGKAKV